MHQPKQIAKTENTWQANAISTIIITNSQEKVGSNIQTPCLAPEWEKVQWKGGNKDKGNKKGIPAQA